MCNIHLFYFNGSKADQEALRRYVNGVIHFKTLAERAGQCVLCLPAHVLDVVPENLREFRDDVFEHDPPSGGYDALLPSEGYPAGRWVEFVYWLSWRNDPEWPLRAERLTWFGNLILPWHATREEYETQGSLFGPHDTFENTRHYFSILGSIFLSSSLAIELILTRLRQAPQGPPISDPPTSDGVLCSKAELLRALGMDETSTQHLESLVAGGRLALSDAIKSVGHARYLATFTDAQEHSRVVNAIRRERLAK